MIIKPFELTNGVPRNEVDVLDGNLRRGRRFTWFSDLRKSTRRERLRTHAVGRDSSRASVQVVLLDDDTGGRDWKRRGEEREVRSVERVVNFVLIGRRGTHFPRRRWKCRRHR